MAVSTTPDGIPHYLLNISTNVPFRWTRDLSAFAAVYNIAAGVIRFQARKTPGAPDPAAYQWATGASAQGTVAFDPVSKQAVFSAPLADMATMQYPLKGDCRLELPGAGPILLFRAELRFLPAVTRLPADASSAAIGAIGDTVKVWGEDDRSPVPMPLSLSAALASAMAQVEAATQAAQDAAASAAAVTAVVLQTAESQAAAMLYGITMTTDRSGPGFALMNG
jgi:hypothetical protein